MRFLALSGSLRAASTNTALLQALANCAGPSVQVEVFQGVGSLPLFSSDLEGAQTPQVVLDFAEQIACVDGLIISCPEYVHALPGGFKNAIDWLVSRPEIIEKPIAILHGSHRGEDALASLRLVLSTVSQWFMPDVFERFELISMSVDEVDSALAQPSAQKRLQGFITRFVSEISKAK